MKTETVAKQDPLWSASVWLLSQKACDFIVQPVCILNSYRSYYYPPKSTSLNQPLCSTEIVSLKLKSGLFNSKLHPQQ